MYVDTCRRLATRTQSLMSVLYV